MRTGYIPKTVTVMTRHHVEKVHFDQSTQNAMVAAQNKKVYYV